MRAKIQARADKAAGKGTAKATGRSKVKTKSKNPPVMKRPAAAAAAAEDSQFDTPVKKPPTSSKARAEPLSAEKTAAPAPTTSNNKEIKKLHSKAYHTVRRDAINDGKSEEDAKAAGREAGRQAINEFVLSAE